MFRYIICYYNREPEETSKRYKTYDEAMEALDAAQNDLLTKINTGVINFMQPTSWVEGKIKGMWYELA